MNIETRKMPGKLRVSTLVPIIKKTGDVQNCSKYHGIKLTSH